MNRYSHDVDALRNKAIELFNNNKKLTCREIAEQLGVSTSTICNYLKYLPGYRKGGGRRKL